MGFGIFEKMSNHGDLMKAVASNDHMLVDDLIKSGKCDPTSNGNEALTIAINKEYMMIIDLLLKDYDVLSTVDWDDVIMTAKSVHLKTYIKRIRAQREAINKYY